MRTPACVLLHVSNVKRKLYTPAEILSRFTPEVLFVDGHYSLKVALSSRYVTGGGATVYFLRGGKNGVMDRSVPPPLQTSQDVTAWTPDQREGKMKGEGRGPRRHICRHYSPGACRAWEPHLSPPQNSVIPPPSMLRLLCLALMAFSPTFSQTTSIIWTPAPESVSFPSCLSSLLCSVMLLHLGFNSASKYISSISKIIL